MQNFRPAVQEPKPVPIAQPPCLVHESVQVAMPFVLPALGEGDSLGNMRRSPPVPRRRLVQIAAARY